MAQIENENISNLVRRIFGLDLDSWNNIIVLFLAIGASAAIIVGIATYIAFQLQKAEAKDASDAFEMYKLGVAAQVADAKKEGIEAGQKAGNAMLRAAELEKEAAELRTKNLAFEAAVSPRIIEQNLTAEALKPFSDVSFLVLSPSDFEPKRTAGQIRFILKQAGWKKLAIKVPKSALPFFDGIVVHPLLRIDSAREREAAEAIVSVLESNGISARTGYSMPIANEDGLPILPNPLPPGEPETTPVGIVIEVGPKPLPKSLQLNPENVPADARGIKVWGNIDNDDN